MKKGETRMCFEHRKREEIRNIAIHRLKADERYIELKLVNIRLKIAAKSAPSTGGKL